MPGGDRTGPLGAGSRTGRGAGYCAGYSGPGYINPVPGRGFWGRGGGRGRRNWYYATGMPGWQRAAYGYPAYGYPAYDGGPYPYTPEPTVEEEKEMLRDEAGALKRELEDIQNRISMLDKAQDQDKKE